MVGLSLFLVVTVGLVVWLTTRESTYHAPLSGTPTATIDQTRATALLDDLRRAVGRRDAAAAGRLGASPAARSDLAGVARNARSLRKPLLMHPPPHAPTVRPPMNAASTAPTAAVVCPVDIVSSRNHATS